MGSLREIWPILFALGVGMTSALVSACQQPQAEQPAAPPPPTTLRLYAIANLAGALEPCGCQQDMRGGLDHAAQLVARERSQVDHDLLVAAGPTFYLHPKSSPEGQQQDAWKARAVARSLNEMGLTAWSPGANDFGRQVAIGQLAELSGAPWVAANLAGAGGQETVVVDRGRLRVGITGISVPRGPDGIGPRLPPDEGETRLQHGLDTLRSRGANLFVALFSLPRGEALRLVERVPGFHVAVVGKPYQVGDANDAATPPVLVGETLVVQPGNLIQSIAAIDLHIVGEDWQLEDASGLAFASRRAHLDRRVAELEERIARWIASGTNPDDVAARREDLERLRAERSALEPRAAPIEGSWLRYSLREVNESVGTHPEVGATILDYYRKVNDHNRIALADHFPLPVPRGQSGYAGGASCIPCHEAADTFWRETRHAKAYATLVERHANYNLECVGCHVTGFGRPGGSTVAQVDGLRNVQCEICHGPGSRHNARPGAPDLITLTPDQSLCASQCHKPPHVPDDWSVEAAWAEQIGPGHGEPLPKPDDADEADEPLSPQEALELLAE